MGVILLKIFGIVWLEDIVEKLNKKHGVQKREIKEVFANLPHFRYVEKGCRPSEDVYAALGHTDAGRYLVVFWVYKKNKTALILSARNMTDSERGLYEKK